MMKVIRNRYSLLIALIALIAGCAEDPRMPGNLIGAAEPTLVFLPDSLNKYITATKVTVYGKVESENGAEVTEKGFVWYKEGESVQSTSSAVTDEADGIFYMTIENLQDSTEYQVLAFARNAVGETRTDPPYSFKTIAGLARVKTVTEPVALRANRAVIRGELLSSGEGPILEKGIAYRKASSQTYTDSILAHSESGNTFEVEITGLEAETEYYVRAYVRNNFGATNGGEVRITTTHGKPTISNFLRNELTETYATFSATIADEGDATVSSRGFIYSTTAEGLNTSSDTIIVLSGQGAGSFTEQLPNLQQQQLYYITPFAENSYGITRGEVQSFVLQSNSPTVTTGEVSIPKSGSLLFKGTLVDWGLNSSAHRYGFVYSSTSPIPTLGAGLEVRVDDLSKQSFEETVSSNIQANTTYHVRAYATNSNGYTSYGETRSIQTPGLFKEEARYPGSYLLEGTPAYVSANKSSTNQDERMLGYLVGGSTGMVPTNDFWEFNPTRQAWRMLDPIPVKRSYASAVYTSSVILVFGGKGEGDVLLNDMYHYGTTWELTPQNTNPPSARYASASSFLNSYMYVIGGISKVNNVETIQNEVCRFAIYPYSWENSVTFPEAQYNGLAFSVGGVLYAGLGLTSLDGSAYSNRFFSIEEYDTSWTEQSQMPGGKALGGTVVGTDIYIVDDQGYIHIYKTEERIWKTVSQRLPVANRKIHCVYGFSGSDKVYIGLGENSRDIISYDPGWDN